MVEFEIIDLNKKSNNQINEIQKHPFSIKKGIIDCIHQYNQQYYDLSNRDESGLLLNGYLREIVLDVTKEDIGFFFHKICGENTCSLWHLRYSLNFPVD